MTAANDCAESRCYDFPVAAPSPESLTDVERAWLEADEARWRRARAIVAHTPGVDATGVYHVLRNLEKSPSERLRAALYHGRLFSAHRG